MDASSRLGEYRDRPVELGRLRIRLPVCSDHGGRCLLQRCPVPPRRRCGDVHLDRRSRGPPHRHAIGRRLHLCGHRGDPLPDDDVINGAVPASFTDDPNDPATLAELKPSRRQIRLHPDCRLGDRDRLRGPGGHHRRQRGHLPPEQLRPDPGPDRRHHDPAMDVPWRRVRCPRTTCAQLTATPKCTETERRLRRPPRSTKSTGTTPTTRRQCDGGGPVREAIRLHRLERHL